MSKEEKIIREYFDFEDVNQSETISVLPLTLVDMLLEYKSKVKKIHKQNVSNRRELLIAYHESRMPKTRESYSIYIEKCVDDFLGNLV